MFGWIKKLLKCFRREKISRKRETTEDFRAFTLRNVAVKYFLLSRGEKPLPETYEVLLQRYYLETGQCPFVDGKWC